MNQIFAPCALLLLACLTARAGNEEPMQRVAPAPSGDVFAKHSWEFQSLTGAFFFVDRSSNRPSVDFALESVRFGLMLSNPHGASFLAGNFEFLNELFVGSIFQGPGNVLAGSTIFLRYNFIQPRPRIVPYLQIGGGLVYTDISERESGGLVSLPVEFNLQGTLGARFMLDERWSLVAEAAYRHLSNAEIKKPNFGIDSIGGNVGLGFFF